MAIIKLNYLSKALLRTVDVTVVLPTDTLDMDTMTYNQKKESVEENMPLSHQP